MPVKLLMLWACSSMNRKNIIQTGSENPENRKVKIQWTEGTDLCVWEGRIERVKDFCPETRTVTFMVRPVKFLKGSSGYFPLLSGMFCKVTFSGITLKNAVKASWLAIQLDGNAYVINKDGRLEQRKIKVFPTKSEEAVIYKGLNEGDFLVVQRLPRGLINGMKVRAINPKTGLTYKAKTGESKKSEKPDTDK